MTKDYARVDLDTIERASDIVAAYVSNNHIAAADLPALIVAVHTALNGIGRTDTCIADAEVAPEKASPSQIRKSIKPDGLISFIDGRAYKTLKRHLTSHGLTPQRYCEQFGLPSDYPMVASSYSETRSNLAKAAGLGQQRGRDNGAEDAQPGLKGRKNAA